MLKIRKFYEVESLETKNAKEEILKVPKYVAEIILLVH